MVPPPLPLSEHVFVWTGPMDQVGRTSCILGILREYNEFIVPLIVPFWSPGPVSVLRGPLLEISPGYLPGDLWFSFPPVKSV